MLAGCSSTLLSPRHRLRSESSAQFQACNFPSMSTQRLDLPCNFSRKETSRSQQPIRPVGISVEKSLESKTSSRSLKQNIRLPPLATTAHQTSFNEGSRREKEIEGKSLKRFADQGSFDDESYMIRAKRKRGSEKSNISQEEGENLRLGQLGSGHFWFRPCLDVPSSLSPEIPFSLSCSGEEERVCFVPSDLISPPFPFSNNPWVDSVVTHITDLGDRRVESRHEPVKEASGSSSSSESKSSGHKLKETTSEHEIGNGSNQPNPNEEANVLAGEYDQNHEENDGFELISLLVACVEAIGSKNIVGINHFIAKLGDLASPRGSTIRRLTAYFTEALALRVSRLWPQVFHIFTPRELDRVVEDDSGTALRLYNQVSPIPKFIHFTSNEIILRAFEGKERVHIVDFDVKQGLQWPSLFQSLASRANPPSHVRITGIGESKQDLIETGDRLAGFAGALNLPFEFHPVVDKLEDVRLWMLHVKEGETVAVSCVFQLHKMLYDGKEGAFRDFMGLIRSINPKIVVMAEQEAEHSDPILEKRLSNSLKYYSALFDSLDSSLPLDSTVRIKIEEVFGREIRNIIACEGRDRIERHEGFGKWKELMEEKGFRCLGIREEELLQSRMLLKMYHFENYSVERRGENGSGLTISWLDQPLYTVSAWTPLDIAGSSSSHSKPN